MSQLVFRECEPRTFAAIERLQGDLAWGDSRSAIQRIENCETPLEAAQLVLGIYCRSGNTLADAMLENLALAAGVLETEDEDYESTCTT